MPGIFAIGDINTYAGKLKFILCEGSLMAQKRHRLCDNKRLGVPIHHIVIEPAEEAWRQFEFLKESYRNGRAVLVGHSPMERSLEMAVVCDHSFMIR